MITFDPTNFRIILDSTEVDTRDVYSEWKRWVATADNAKYLPAFRIVGGDPLGGDRSIPSYLFLLNGWRIRPMEVDHTLNIGGGQISVEEGGDIIVPTLGSHQVVVLIQNPVAAIGVASDGGSSTGPTADQIANAVLAKLNANIIPVNIKKVNDHTVTGVGTEDNPWGPV